MRETIIMDANSEQTSPMKSCLLKKLFCGTSFFSNSPENRTTTEFYESLPHCYSDSLEKSAYQTQPTSVNQEWTYNSIKNYIIDILKNPIKETHRSVSMYEIGSSSYGNFETNDIHTHYQKLMCQLSMSNSSLLRENESFRIRFQHLQNLLRNHIDHLHNIYYTLYLSGFSQIQFPDGENVDLSEFRGIELKLLSDNNANDKFHQRRSFDANSTRSQSGLSGFSQKISENHWPNKTEKQRISSEAEEMKIAMLKCIMKPKCGDIDEYLQWLNDHHLATESDAATQQRMIVDEAQNSIKSKAFRQERNESKADLKNEYIGLKEASNQSSELLKAKGVVQKQRHRTMSLSSAARMNSYTLATKRNNTSEKSVTSRKSLTNLSSLRSNTKKSTRGNLI